jgi:hypothetical protein
VHREKCEEALPLARESLERARDAVPPEPLRVADGLAIVGFCLNALSRFAEAEPLLRDCLAIREARIPGDLRRYNAMSLLGECLAGLERYEEAEPLLVEGYEKMESPEGSGRWRERALDRVIAFYEAWGKPEAAERWRSKRSD